MAWGGCVGAAGYPMGCQIGRRRGTKRHWRDLRRPLKFPNLIVSLTRFSHVLEGFPGPLGSIWRRPRRLVIEIRQIWGLVSPPVHELKGHFALRDFFAFLVFSAFKMRVYLGRIVELDREPTCEVGPELAIYRSVTVTGCDEHRGRRGEQAAPFFISSLSIAPPRRDFGCSGASQRWIS